MAAGAKLDLTRDAELALAFAAVLLAYARDRKEQAALSSAGSLAVLAQLLQARSLNMHASMPACHGSLPARLPSAPDRDKFLSCAAWTLRVQQADTNPWLVRKATLCGCEVRAFLHGVQARQDAPLQGQGRGSSAAQATLGRLLRDSPLGAGMPAAERGCACSVALCALSGVHAQHHCMCT